MYTYMCTYAYIQIAKKKKTAKENRGAKVKTRTQPRALFIYSNMQTT